MGYRVSPVSMAQNGLSSRSSTYRGVIRLRRVINILGKEPQVDPHSVMHRFLQWKKSAVCPDGRANQDFFTDISPLHADALVRYILDMEAGRNVARGSKKGQRGFQHLLSTASRLRVLLRQLEEHTGKRAMDFVEERVIDTFNAMRSGQILSTQGKVYQSTWNYAKIFRAFWRWHIRRKRKEGIHVPDITEDLDSGVDRKPAWSYFTLDGAKKMAALTNLECRALILFLFDSGIRAPKEMMNVRVKDLTDIPDSENLCLNIRHETSKTFGRKIKLLLCSQVLKEYIKTAGLHSEDFLFSANPATYNKRLGQLGFKALGIGERRESARKDGGAPFVNIRGGVTMYDFRHNSVCYYLPIYKGESQLMYRFGWNNSSMIRYYSEWMGMRDTIGDDDILVDTTRTEVEQQLEAEKGRSELLKEQLKSQGQELAELRAELADGRDRDKAILELLQRIAEKGDREVLVKAVRETGISASG